MIKVNDNVTLMVSDISLVRDVIPWDKIHKNTGIKSIIICKSDPEGMLMSKFTRDEVEQMIIAAWYKRREIEQYEHNQF